MQPELDVRYFEIEFDHLSRADIAALAMRAALRVLPAVRWMGDQGRSSPVQSVIWSALRLAFVSLTAARWPSPDLISVLEDDASDTSRADVVAGKGGGAYYAIYAVLSVAFSLQSQRSVPHSLRTCANAFSSAAVNPDGPISAVNGAPAIAARHEAVVLMQDDLATWSKLGVEALLAAPLWPRGAPEWARRDWDAFRAYLDEDASLSFWRRWYERLLGGQPQDWTLFRWMAVEISPEDWQAGPGRVAERIAEIEEKHAPDLVRPQALRLAAMPALVETTAEGLAQQIEAWISACLREAEANALPEELAALGDLPAILRRIGSAVLAEEAQSETKPLETAIEEMAVEIERLKADLALAKQAPKESLFWTSFQKKAGESLGDWKMWGALASGGYLLLGPQIGSGALSDLVAMIRPSAEP